MKTLDQIRQTPEIEADMSWEDIVDLYDDEELHLPDDFAVKLSDVSEKDVPLDHQFDEMLSKEDLEALERQVEGSGMVGVLGEEIIALNEDLSAQQRLVKRINFAKSKAKRLQAQKILLKRVSNPARLRKRAISMAKRILMKKLLMGRDKSQLSPGEKSRIENILKKSAPIISRLTNQAIPKVRQIERSRLK